MSAVVFLSFPTGSDGRHRVSISASEVASYRSYTVVSYSYQEWVQVTLKNGVQHDCHVTMAEFEKRLQDAAAVIAKAEDLS